MITREADYCVRTILYLAKPENQGRPVSATELSENMSIPYRFLRKISTKLVAAGFLKSRRGRSGGLTLTRKPQEITLLEILKQTDARGVLLNTCLDSQENCPREKFCTIHHEIQKLQTVLENHLQEISFDRLI
jgi:Rrf2 family protein